MENILLAINATKPNNHALEFASYLAALTHSKLTGVFLENLVADEKPVIKQFYDGTYINWEVDENSEEYQKKISLIKKYIDQFKEHCASQGVICNIHTDKDVPARELIRETRYADILVVDAETSFKENADELPTGFVKEVLRETECPVIIAPYHFEEVNEIIFSYDGSKSSVFAIKQFIHLFPEFRNKKVTVLQVNEKPDLEDAETKRIEELLKLHYNDIQFRFLQGKASDELFEYLLKRKNIFLVMGAFGRGKLSSLFKHSTAELVVKSINLPVFIAHY